MRTTKASDYHWAIRRHFKTLDPSARFNYEKPCGNVRLDMVVQCNGEKVAVEIKSKNDNAIRGLAELAVAKAYGYNKRILVTTKRNALSLDLEPFSYYGFQLAFVDAKGQMHFRGF